MIHFGKLLCIATIPSLLFTGCCILAVQWINDISSQCRQSNYIHCTSGMVTQATNYMWKPMLTCWQREGEVINPSYTEESGPDANVRDGYSDLSPELGLDPGSTPLTRSGSRNFRGGGGGKHFLRKAAAPGHTHTQVPCLFKNMGVHPCFCKNKGCMLGCPTLKSTHIFTYQKSILSKLRNINLSTYFLIKWLHCNSHLLHFGGLEIILKFTVMKHSNNSAYSNINKSLMIYGCVFCFVLFFPLRICKFFSVCLSSAVFLNKSEMKHY